MKQNATSWTMLASRVAILLLLVFGGTSCTTTKLWGRFDPDKKIWIPADKITEAELQQKGLEYEHVKNEIMDGYVVEPDKNAFEKLGDYSILILATPVTLAADVAGGTVVIGYNAFTGKYTGNTPGLDGAFRAVGPLTPLLNFIPSNK